ncbi:MAG TPA: SMC-Scp complex subunit ScpB [Acidimicrobiales bacterium]|jgi:segregation and condensation protein B|nr:SMC-Scp complex subunit ScpB [Acidimicrobiales bacterium]
MRGELSLEQKLEAMLTVALEPISAEELADVVDAEAAVVRQTLADLRAEFLEQRRGFQVVELASGWVMQSSPDVAAWVTKFANRDVSHRLSSAALESLAIIAYRQPVSRAQISALRGVNVDGVVRLLEQRGYIEELGRAPGPGQPILYGTTESFLDRMGLATLNDLPPIEEFMPPIETANELAEEIAERFDDSEVS